MNQMSATQHLPLVTILQTAADIRHYHVPKYQREYTWGRREWEQMFDDIKDNHAGYFMGSVICVHGGGPLAADAPFIYEVVDGQQRFTTISVILMSVYRRILELKNRLSPEDEDEKDDHRLTLSEIKGRLVYIADKGNLKHFVLRVRPSAQNNNLNDYCHILKELRLIDGEFTRKYCKSGKIYKAYNYFYGKLPDDFGGIKEMLQKILGLTFVQIAVTSSADACVLFESLNNRGIPLSAIDIIKNKMLAELEKKYGTNIDDAFDEWQKLLECLPEYKEQERFLRHYYNAFKVDSSVGIENFARATKSNLIRIYEKHIETDAKATLDGLLAKARIYRSFLDPEASGFTDARRKSLLDLGRAGAASSYLFLLYLYSLPAENIADRDPTIDAILAFFIKYYVRRNITDFPNTRDLDTINMGVIKKCDEHIRAGNPLTSDFVIEQFLNSKEGHSEIGKLKKALGGNLFSDNVGMARFVLARLGEENAGKESCRDLWKRNEKGKLVWTIEHIFPQNKKIPAHWVDMIANGDKEKAQEIQEKCGHCLGNLTLSGYNPNLSNKGLEEKQNMLNEHGVASGYKNGLRLNQLRFSVDGEETSLAEISRWTEDSIMARNDAMVGALVKEFAFDDDELAALKKDGGA